MRKGGGAAHNAPSLGSSGRQHAHASTHRGMQGGAGGPVRSQLGRLGTLNASGLITAAAALAPFVLQALEPLVTSARQSCWLAALQKQAMTTINTATPPSSVGESNSVRWRRAPGSRSSGWWRTARRWHTRQQVTLSSQRRTPVGRLQHRAAWGSASGLQGLVTYREEQNTVPSVLPAVNHMRAQESHTSLPTQ